MHFSPKISSKAGGQIIILLLLSLAGVIQQYLNLGVIDELEIALAPVVFGGGRRPFENLREPVQRFRIDKVHESPAATHLRYVRE